MPMSAESLTGYVGNLEPWQEEKLRQFWATLIQLWDAHSSSRRTPEHTRRASLSSNDTNTTTTAKSPRRGFFSLTRQTTTQATDDDSPPSPVPPMFLPMLKTLGATPSDLKAAYSLLTKISGDRLQTAYLRALKQEHPDAQLLRFLRAEKWNVPRAWIKFVSALHWRTNEYRIDEEVLCKGEKYHLERSRQEEDSVEKRDGENFMMQLRSGKGFFHGADRYGRPICVIRARAHTPSEKALGSLRDYIVHCIETVRFLQVAPVETMTILFDLTSFSLSSWDFPAVKFIIECFQENYPESLGAIIFYKAPWFFSGLWKLIQAILDPVVAAKVYFIDGPRDLERIVPPSQIIRELGGRENWEYRYQEPLPCEDDRLHDTATRDSIFAERRALGEELFAVTAEWIADPESYGWVEPRELAIMKMHDNYWTLDPYVRARTLLDRTGVIKDGGIVDFYPARTNVQVYDEKPAVVGDWVIGVPVMA
ncbi:CRAL-TRIO domain-containing protein [Aspergillus candidus]|uniref:CRAL/TRIO domain protein n=1 Tax=Aspergillus candidus TaxID=41067 RepID=A0A2I2F8B0_ASPCN|nr:CRAL/TRIO domain protein [Aspergillus candidus]PLB36867.1 CRAL/TRIO domain protein [Aspergillus candidus]